jgi:plasmid stability protein
MMSQMVVRNIPDDVMARFKKSAKALGKTTEAYARQVIEENAGASREEIIKEIDAIRAKTVPVDLQTTLKIMEEVRSERDARPNLAEIDDN